MNNDELAKRLNALEEYRVLKNAVEEINTEYDILCMRLQIQIKNLKSAQLDYTTLQSVLDLIEEDYAVMGEYLNEILKSKGEEIVGIDQNPTVTLEIDSFVEKIVENLNIQPNDDNYQEIKAAVLQAMLDNAKKEGAQTSSSIVAGDEEKLEAIRKGKPYTKKI